MYPGWMVIGNDDPFGVDPADMNEIVNNARAYAYAANSGICWLEECNTCSEAAVVVPGGPDFLSPILDPAPWYDANDPDSWGFLGVIGLEVVGAESSTRQATVTMGLTGGGIIGPTYMGPRTLVVRALAIATDECSLQYGLTWLRSLYQASINPCEGDRLTFFDCCPCVCENDEPGGPCWPIDYFELRTHPDCISVVTPAVPAFLDLGTGTATTPDTPDMAIAAGQKVRLSLGLQLDTVPASGFPTIIIKQGPGGIPEREYMAFSSALTVYASSADTVGGQATAVITSPPLDAGTLHSVAIEMTQGSTTGTAIVDGISAPRGFPTAVGLPNTTAPVTIGGVGAGFDGRVTWAQLERLDAAGNVTGTVWRFDASEYPGTGTTFVDPRGRTWTLSSAAAITPAVDEVLDIWWPETYEELMVGPPSGDDEWCSWPQTYQRLRTGPNSISCCVDECVVPYLRQFYNVRVTSGPNVLRHPAMYSDGALAEIEFTIVCADPAPHAMPGGIGSALIEPGVPFTDPPITQHLPDPFALATVASVAAPASEPDGGATAWLRSSIELREKTESRVLTGIRQTVRLTARERTGPVRVGLWVGDQRVAGYRVPFIPEHTSIYLNGRDSHALVNGEYRRLPPFVRDWDGRYTRDEDPLPHGDYTLTIDQEPEHAVPLVVNVTATPVGAG